MYRIAKIDIPSFFVYQFIIGIAIVISVDTYLIIATSGSILPGLAIGSAHGFALWNVVTMTFAFVYNALQKSFGGIRVEVEIDIDNDQPMKNSYWKK